MIKNTKIEPVIEFRDDVLNLHVLYLEKVELLNDAERDAFCCYLNLLSNPPMIIKERGYARRRS